MSFAPLAAAKNVTAGTGGTDRLALDYSVGKVECVMVTNASAVRIFVAFGASTVTVASTNGFPIAAGLAVCLIPPVAATHIAIVAESATAVVYVTEGLNAV